MSRLIACSSCRRHVRMSDAACPFCRAPLPKTVPSRGRPVGRLGRAAIVVATTTGVAGAAAVDLSGCGDAPIMAADAYGLDAPDDFVTGADAYGIPFDQFVPDARDAGDADADAPIFGDAYGLPPDSGSD